MKTLLVCHGNAHVVPHTTFLTIEDIRAGDVLTLDIDKNARPDFVQDFSSSRLTKRLRPHLGTFDRLFVVFAPCTDVFPGDGYMISKQVIQNVEALLKDGGTLCLHTTLVWFAQVQGVTSLHKKSQKFISRMEKQHDRQNAYKNRCMAAGVRKALKHQSSCLRLLTMKEARKLYMPRRNLPFIIQKSSIIPTPT